MNGPIPAFGSLAAPKLTYAGPGASRRRSSEDLLHTKRVRRGAWIVCSLVFLIGGLAGLGRLATPYAGSKPLLLTSAAYRARSAAEAAQGHQKAIADMVGSLAQAVQAQDTTELDNVSNEVSSFQDSLVAWKVPTMVEPARDDLMAEASDLDNLVQAFEGEAHSGSLDTVVATQDEQALASAETAARSAVLTVVQETGASNS